MARLEKEVIDKANAGLDLFIEVKPIYRGADPVPWQIRYRVVTTDAHGLKPYNPPTRILDVPRPAC
jgi:hypothetical protein